MFIPFKKSTNIEYGSKDAAQTMKDQITSTEILFWQRCKIQVLDKVSNNTIKEFMNFDTI